MLATRLRLLAWLLAPLVLVAIVTSVSVGLPVLRELYSANLRDPFGLPEPLWLLRHLHLLLALMVASLPLACVPTDTFGSASARTRARRSALLVGSMGALAIYALHLRVDLGLVELSDEVFGVGLSARVYTWQSALMLCGWLPVVMLAQSHLLELWSLRERGREILARGATFAGAWLLAGLAAGCLASSGRELARASQLWEVERLALVPLLALLLAELGVRMIASIAPRLRRHWRDERAQTRALRELGNEEQTFSPDPYALARGHRLRSHAGKLRATAWLLLPVNLCVWIQVYTPIEHGLAWNLALVPIALLAAYLELRSFAPRSTPLDSHLDDDPQLREAPSVVALLELLHRCAELLEHDQDLAYDELTHDLASAISALPTSERRLLDARGADPQLLLRKLFETHEPGQPLTRDRRRALHHQLHKYRARVQRESLRSPYRADLRGLVRATGLGWLAGGRSPLDRQLGRTRRQLFIAVSLVGLVALACAQLLGARQSSDPLDVCIPGVGLCRWAITPTDAVLVIACMFALAPLWLWMVARVTEWAGELSFAFALPPDGELEPSRDAVIGLMYSAWTSTVQVGQGERSVFLTFALGLLTLPPLLASNLLMDLGGASNDLEGALVVGTAFVAGILVLRPLQLCLARLAAALCDD